MNKKTLFIFIAIVIIGALFRIYKVTEIPPGINRDEGSIGYTAYSLLTTGKDEYGLPYPLSFQSFGDWKLPLYIYSIIPAVAFLGLNELSVRSTSILAGIATIVLTYFLVKELFKNELVSILAMVLVAISPWHIHLSRVGSEANTAVFLTTASVLLFLKALQGKPYLFIFSGILLSLTYYTYAGNYIFTSLLFIGILFLYRFYIPINRWSISAGIIFTVLSLFIFSQTVFSANKTKLSGISIFGDPSIVHAQIEIPRNEHTGSFLFSKVVHNRVIFGAERFAQNYLNSFSPQFLFISGGKNNAHNIQNFGNMYIAEALFLLIGFMYLVCAKKTKEVQLVIWWLLIAPIAASITKDAPHSARMFAVFPVLPIITAFGFFVFWQHIQQYKWKYIVLFFVVSIGVLNIGMYIDRYFIHFPKNESIHWGVGYEKLLEVLENNKQKDVIISRPEYSPYIFLLFYSHYSPSTYIKKAERYPLTSDGFLHVRRYDQFEFREIDWNNDIKKTNTILIADPLEVPDFVYSGPYKKSTIVLDNGKNMFVLVENQ